MRNKEIDNEIKKYKEDRFCNEYYEIDDLPLTQEQKKCVLEWLAQKYWYIIRKTGDDDGHCKHYDPLMIDGKCAHSYIFELEDGGRHHSFKNLKYLEKMLNDEIIKRIKQKDE